VHFAYALPWWLAAVLAAAVGAAAFLQYRRPLVPLSRAQHAALVAMRIAVLGALVVFLFRPMVDLPPSSVRDSIVPILIDGSRSMRIADVDGQPRIARAVAQLKTTLLPQLANRFVAEMYSVGDAVTPLDPAAIDRLGADARRTDLSGALDAIRDRYRGQRVAGIVVISDGGNTGDIAGDRSARRGPGAAAAGADGPPVYAIGIGSPEGLHDREVLALTAGDPRIDRSSVDLHVSAVAHGFGRQPFSLRVTANGRPLDTRRVVPPADGSPVDEVFTVSPDPVTPTVYAAEIPPDATESVAENNVRSVLVNPAGRKRRVLMLEGAPGFEHSFITRAWAGDPGLEVDVVTRKGKNAEGQDTFFVQAGAGRAPSLTSGFPQNREALFVYDAVVIANLEADYFTRAQLTLLADYVGERGGGLLLMGGRSFAQRGMSATPLEEVLPVELNDRRGGVVHTALPDQTGAHNKVSLTADGEIHPIMRLGTSPEETKKRWAALPALAASAALGGPRPGAKILALTASPGGGLLPVVAVQRYGHGRSMIFAGEASWRWKMMVASDDRSYDVFWRQTARWLSADSPDPVDITLPDAPEPGDVVAIDIDARDGSFVPVPDATLDVTLTAPGADPTPVKWRRVEAGSGRYTAAISPDRPGLYRVRAEARRGAASLGTAERWLYVGGGDREFADPRLNEGWLRRLARSTGGRYARAADASQVGAWLQAAAPQTGAPERRDLWHEPWAFAAIVLLLSAEWMLRRRWGLR
jgi:uncharacterized membrane protein